MGRNKLKRLADFLRQGIVMSSNYLQRDEREERTEARQELRIVAREFSLSENKIRSGSILVNKKVFQNKPNQRREKPCFKFFVTYKNGIFLLEILSQN